MQFYTPGLSFSDSEGDPAAIGTAADGTSTFAARRNHVHAIADQTVTSRMVDLTAQTAAVATSETTTSTSYTDLATAGPAVTLSPGVTQDHFLTLSSLLSNNTLDTAAIASVAIAGAAAVDADAAFREGNANARVLSAKSVLAVAQTSGATHTMKFRAGGGTMAAQLRRIIGVAL